MVEGRLRKYYEEVVLVEQVWVLDPDKKVKAVLDEAGNVAGAPVTVPGFVRMALGEGVEQAEQDFGAEVATALTRLIAGAGGAPPTPAPSCTRRLARHPTHPRVLPKLSDQALLGGPEFEN